MAWLPRGFELNKYTSILKNLASGDAWQIYNTSDNKLVLAVLPDLTLRWDNMQLLPHTLFQEYSVNGDTFHILISDSDNLISSLEQGPYPKNYPQAKALAIAIKLTREIVSDLSFGDGLFIEKYSRILPTFSGITDSDSIVLGRFLTGGVNISTDSYDSLCRFVSWMKPDALADIITTAGLQTSDGNTLIAVDEKEKTEQATLPQTQRKNIQHQPTDRFELPGRPQLEEFFNEHIVDIVLNAEKYKRMGIGFPSAVILHGAPGCGKTFAVDRLAEFLGWPTYRIESGTIGSPYIHDTSRKIAEVFDTAIQNAPSMLIIDEMEAFLTDRGTAQASGQHHLEEVAEFLRRIPEATSKNVLVMAMTNMISSIDPAILRRGRFDHIIEVKMPTKDEVASLLKKQLRDLPISDDVDIDMIAERLQGRALSDVTYVIREAGRAAVKQDKDIIDMQLFLQACDTLPEGKKERRKIGF